MPSRFEPCGLGQMIAMRYGALPVATKTGGLSDTVFEQSESGKKANGFLSAPGDAAALGAALDRALAAYAATGWGELVRGAMQTDFSWDRSVERYVELYRAIFRPRKKAADRWNAAATAAGERLAAALALAAVAAVVSLALDAENGRRVLIAAVEADDAVAVCRRSSYSLGDFWDRARAVGIGAVVLREKPVSYLADRGDVLIFTRQELEKWRATGLLAPGAQLDANSLWARDETIQAQIVASAESRGIAVSTGAANGFHLVEFPAGLDPSLPAGLDPEVLHSLRGRTLVVIRASSEKLLPVGLSWKEDGPAAGTSPADADAELVLEPVSVPVEAPQARWLRAAFSHPRRLLLARLKLDAGVEENFDLLRSSLRRSRARRRDLIRSRARAVAAAFLAVARARPAGAGGLAFGRPRPSFRRARAGLLALKRVRSAVMARWPIASPVPQLAAGLATAALVAVGIGAAVRLACGAGRDLPPPSWSFWALAGPFLIGALTLYPIDPQDWSARLAKPVTGWVVARLLAAAFCATMILAPRAAAGLFGAAAPFRLPGPAWWFSWRWREILVGIPCLLQALALINWRVDCPDCESDKGPWPDPRGWFLLGMLWPIGIIVALGRGGAPVELTLSQTLLVFAAGTALGVFGVALRLRLAHGPKGPEQ